jgi:5-methylcytosine-specific restriction endonuclease McrA
MIKRSTTTRDKARAKLKAKRAACHICGQPIDYGLEWSEPRSFVVDHVIPLAKGGRDEPANMAAAHRDCNSTKRARMVAPIIRRSNTLA